MRRGTMRFALVAAAAAAAVAALPCFAQDPAAGGPGSAEKLEDDPIFRAVHDELERAKSLALPDLDKPYHLQAYVNDDDSFNVSAAFGALTREGGGRSASLSTSVRVGSADLDNTNFSGGGFSFGGMGGPGAPEEVDYDALRQSLWLSFDGDYKEATESIAKKRAYLASNTVKDRPPDFAPAPVVDLVLPRLTLAADKDRWRDVVKRVSRTFRDYPYVHDCGVSVSLSVGHQYFLSSDPARHRFGSAYANFSIWCSTQAPDGMPLQLSWQANGRTESDLPDEDVLVSAAHQLAKQIGDLAAAPTADDYWGPVLFTGDASCRFFLDTVGAPLSNPRPSLGASTGGRLLERLGRRIAARTLVARDDPTQAQWRNLPLLGHYPVDDDGVLPEPVSLIENGVLKSYFMSRVPTKLIAKTNGHSRAGRGSTSNLFIEGREAVPREELERQMLEMCKEEDLEYGLVVEQFSGGGGFGGGSGDISLPTPMILWRLHQDGRRELVRGATFKAAPQRILKDIVAIGSDPQLLNTTQFQQRVSVVAPSVLISEMELRRPREEFQKPPYSERP